MTAGWAKKLFAFGVVAAAGVFVFYHYVFVRPHVSLTSLLNGDEAVRIARARIEGQRRLVTITDPQLLDVLACALRQSRRSPTPPTTVRWTYVATFSLSPGGRQATTMYVDGDGRGFTIAVTKSPVELGFRDPEHYVVRFDAEVPALLREMLGFLCAERSRGVLHLAGD